MRWIGLLVLCLMLQVVSLTSAQEGDCTGLVTPLLSAGATGRVRQDDGVGLALHSEASPDSAILANLPEGAPFVTMNGAVCADGWVWWEVRLADLREGYLAEGNATRYFAEPYVTGAVVLLPDATNINQVNRVLVDETGQPQMQPPLILTPQGGTAGSLWQSFEITAANLALADRLVNCAERVPVTISGDVSSVMFETHPRTYYPTADGTQLLLFRDYLIDVPRCDGQAEQFGTTYVYLADPQQGERLIFPYSQKSEPPPGQFCQPPTVPHADYATYMEEIAWSQDGRYAALSVRYLRNSEFFPCAFYHIFVIDTTTLNVQYIGEGQRVGWGDQGRLYFARIERTDPNTVGVQRLWSIRPDGEDRVEIPVPGTVSLISSLRLPYNADGTRLLACATVACDEVVTLSLRTLQLSAACAVPVIGQAYFIAGDTAVLWHGEDGTAYYQKDCAADQLVVDGDIETVSVGLMGAVLRLTDGRLFFYSWHTQEITPVIL